jgi:hypothetical protein
VDDDDNNNDAEYNDDDNHNIRKDGRVSKLFCTFYVFSTL